jgi:hypothetical protein
MLEKKDLLYRGMRFAGKMLLFERMEDVDVKMRVAKDCLEHGLIIDVMKG